MKGGSLAHHAIEILGDELGHPAAEVTKVSQQQAPVFLSDHSHFDRFFVVLRTERVGSPQMNRSMRTARVRRRRRGASMLVMGQLASARARPEIERGNAPSTV